MNRLGLLPALACLFAACAGSPYVAKTRDDNEVFDVISKGDIPAVKAWLDAAPDRKAALNRDLGHFTPLQVAAGSGQLKMTEYLLDQGAPVNVVNPYDNWTPLKDSLQASFVGPGQDIRRPAHCDVASLLVKRGADPSGLDSLLKQRCPDVLAQIESPILEEALKTEKAADAAKDEGRENEALGGYAAALASLQRVHSAHAIEKRLREKSIALALSMSPPPTLPDEVRSHTRKGQAFIMKAQGEQDFRDGVREFRLAVLAAPWYADGYVNLALAREKTKDFAGAIESLRLYLKAAPHAADADKIQEKIDDLEVEKTQAARKGSQP